MKRGFGKKQSFLHETNLKKLQWRLLNTKKFAVCGLHAKSFVLHSTKAMSTRCRPSSLPVAFAMKRPYVIFKKNVTNTSDYANGNHFCIGKHETCSHLNVPATGIRCQSLIGSMFFQVFHETETQNKNP